MDTWDLIPFSEQRKVIRALLALGGAGTRLDATVDDYGPIATVADVKEAARRYNFTGFRRVKIEDEFYRGKASGESQGFGRKGSDGSGKFRFVYNKYLESGGEINSVRWEARFFKKHAALWAQALADCDDDAEYRRAISRAVGGVIDFRLRGADPNVDRMPRLVWWAKLLEQIGSASVCVPRVVPPLQKTAEWVFKSVCPALALLQNVSEGQGDDFWGMLRDAVEKSQDRIDWKVALSRKLGLDVAAAFEVNHRAMPVRYDATDEWFTPADVA